MLNPVPAPARRQEVTAAALPTHVGALLRAIGFLFPTIAEG